MSILESCGSNRLDTLDLDTEKISFQSSFIYFKTVYESLSLKDYIICNALIKSSGLLKKVAIFVSNDTFYIFNIKHNSQLQKIYSRNAIGNIRNIELLSSNNDGPDICLCTSDSNQLSFLIAVFHDSISNIPMIIPLYHLPLISMAEPNFSQNAYGSFQPYLAYNKNVYEKVGNFISASSFSSNKFICVSNLENRLRLFYDSTEFKQSSNRIIHPESWKYIDIIEEGLIWKHTFLNCKNLQTVITPVNGLLACLVSKRNALYIVIYAISYDRIRSKRPQFSRRSFCIIGEGLVPLAIHAFHHIPNSCLVSTEQGLYYCKINTKGKIFVDSLPSIYTKLDPHYDKAPTARSSLDDDLNFKKTSTDSIYKSKALSFCITSRVSNRSFGEIIYIYTDHHQLVRAECIFSEQVDAINIEYTPLTITEKDIKDVKFLHRIDECDYLLLNYFSGIIEVVMVLGNNKVKNIAKYINLSSATDFIHFKNKYGSRILVASNSNLIEISNGTPKGYGLISDFREGDRIWTLNLKEIFCEDKLKGLFPGHAGLADSQEELIRIKLACRFPEDFDLDSLIIISDSYDEKTVVLFYSLFNSQIERLSSHIDAFNTKEQTLFSGVISIGSIYLIQVTKSDIRLISNNLSLIEKIEAEAPLILATLYDNILITCDRFNIINTYIFNNGRLFNNILQKNMNHGFFDDVVFLELLDMNCINFMHMLEYLNIDPIAKCYFLVGTRKPSVLVIAVDKSDGNISIINELLLSSDIEIGDIDIPNSACLINYNFIFSFRNRDSLISWIEEKVSYIESMNQMGADIDHRSMSFVHNYDFISPLILVGSRLGNLYVFRLDNIFNNAEEHTVYPDQTIKCGILPLSFSLQQPFQTILSLLNDAKSSSKLQLGLIISDCTWSISLNLLDGSVDLVHANMPEVKAISHILVNKVVYKNTNFNDVEFDNNEMDKLRKKFNKLFDFNVSYHSVGGYVIKSNESLEFISTTQSQSTTSIISSDHNAYHVLNDPQTNLIIISNLSITSRGFCSKIDVINDNNDTITSYALPYGEKIRTIYIWNIRDEKRYICAGIETNDGGKVMVFGLKDSKEGIKKDWKLKLLGEVSLPFAVTCITSFIGSYLLVSAHKTFYQLKIETLSRKLVIRLPVEMRYKISAISTFGRYVNVAGDFESITTYRYCTLTKSFTFLKSDIYSRPILNCVSIMPKLSISSDQIGCIIGLSAGDDNNNKISTYSKDSFKEHQMELLNDNECNCDCYISKNDLNSKSSSGSSTKKILNQSYCLSSDFAFHLGNPIISMKTVFKPNLPEILFSNAHLENLRPNGLHLFSESGSKVKIFSGYSGFVASRLTEDNFNQTNSLKQSQVKKTNKGCLRSRITKMDDVKIKSHPESFFNSRLLTDQSSIQDESIPTIYGINSTGSIYGFLMIKDIIYNVLKIFQDSCLKHEYFLPLLGNDYYDYRSRNLNGKRCKNFIDGDLLNMAMEFILNNSEGSHNILELAYINEGDKLWNIFKQDWQLKNEFLDFELDKSINDLFSLNINQQQVFDLIKSLNCAVSL